MKKEANIFYSLPEVWDFCLEKIYNKSEYISGFLETLQKYDITSKSLILDAGCGSGFPSLDLIEKGYHVIGTDKSSEMVRQIRINAKNRGLNIEAHHIMWAGLAEHFEPMFDLVYCRGNSLIYAASWEQNWIVPSRSREEIYKAIKNFYQIIKPGGILCLDVTNRNERPHQENIGIVETKTRPIEILWKIEHNTENKIRTWTIILKFLDTGEEKKYPSYSYLITKAELLNFLHQAGFHSIDEEVPVIGETNYNVYIAKKI